jgi:hypothetical protein
VAASFDWFLMDQFTYYLIDSLTIIAASFSTIAFLGWLGSFKLLIEHFFKSVGI